jgi:hypothetical protein
MKEPKQQAAATKTTTATVDKDEAKMIAAIDVGGTNDGAYNSDANSDGNDNNGNGNGNGDRRWRQRRRWQRRR